MKLFISNIGRMVTDESLRAIFATHGKVEFIQISKNNTNFSNNNAFVQMPDEAEALIAMNLLNGSIINGSQMVVESIDPERSSEFK